MSNGNESHELYHHGILGMKWGVRRYQNKDGTLTPAGRKKAAKMKEQYTALTGKRLVRKPTPKNTNASTKKKSIKDMSDTEIKDKITRLENEKRLAGLQDETATTGKKIASAIGKQVVAPALIDVGKRLLTDSLMKIGKEKLGLNTDLADDAFSKLQKDAKVSRLKRQLEQDKDWFEEREAKKAKSKVKDAADKVKEEAKKTKEETERWKAEYIRKDQNKSSDSSEKKKTVIIDIEPEIRDAGHTTVNKYMDLQIPYYERKRLPGPKR